MRDHVFCSSRFVCEGTLREHLGEDLRRYFSDVFVPMAHAVQIAPPVEYCARWSLEHAMWYVLRAVAQGGTLREGVLERQESAARLRRGRCAAQMHEVGLCALRGVYDIVPNATDGGANATDTPAGCAFAGPAHSVSGCALLYYTSCCLLYCDCAFYDPCLCAGSAGGDAIRFSHRARTSVALRYTGQRIVVFSLAGVASGDDVEHAFDSMRKLKAGVLFCTENGVKTFAPTHVLVFADFPVPRKTRTHAAEAAPAETVATAETPAQAA